jgi:hypothetical protein
MKENFTIYAHGITHCSVCCDKDYTLEEIELTTNAMEPTGISSTWKVSKEKFKGGEDNPCVCHDDKNRMHYLMCC